MKPSHEPGLLPAGGRLRVLLIGSSPSDARLLRAILTDVQSELSGLVPEFELAHAATLRSAFARLARSAFHVILFDLNVRRDGLSAFSRVRERAPQTPVIVLTGLLQDRLALEAIRRGAQDYLIREQIDGRLLVRVMRCAIERQQLREAEIESRRHLDLLQHQLGLAKAVQAISRAMLAAQSMEDVAKAALSRIRQLVPCVRANVTVFDLRTRRGKVIAALAEDIPRGPGAPVSLRDYRGLDVLQRGELYEVEDLAAVRRPTGLQRALQAPGVRAQVSVPMIVDGRLVGSLNLGMSTPGHFDIEHARIARELADLMAIAIEPKRERARAGGDEPQRKHGSGP